MDKMIEMFEKIENFLSSLGRMGESIFGILKMIFFLPTSIAHRIAVATKDIPGNIPMTGDVLGTIKMVIMVFCGFLWYRYLREKTQALGFDLLRTIAILYLAYVAVSTLGNSGLYPCMIMLMGTLLMFQQDMFYKIINGVSGLVGKSFGLAGKGIAGTASLAMLGAKGLAKSLDGLDILRGHPRGKEYKKAFLDLWHELEDGDGNMDPEQFRVTAELLRDSLVQASEDEKWGDEEMIETVFNTVIGQIDLTTHNATPGGAALKESALAMTRPPV